MDRCIRSSRRSSRWLLALGIGAASAMGVASSQAQEMCGGSSYPFPYTDVSGVVAAFCPGIMEAYVTGISKGTSPTMFSPNDDVIRLQMATFLQRTVDQVLTRGSRRAALNQWWVPQSGSLPSASGLTGNSRYCAGDGANIWTTTDAGTVVKIEASSGSALATWTGASSPRGVLFAAGNVYVTGQTPSGALYQIQPSLPAGTIIQVGDGFGGYPNGIAYDGTNIWTANESGSVSIYKPGTITATTVATGFESPFGILYDGAHIWVTDFLAGTLLELSSSGGIIQTVTVGTFPVSPVFDGTNIWVPNLGSNSITVVQASTAKVVATISQNASNQLNGPMTASFDGERVLVTNHNGSTVTVFKAADLSFIANVSTSTATPYGACSDGINFWITTDNASELLRF
jgi:YVTN family beta-propeller protein